MCVQSQNDCFDPDICPLLKGLPLAEQQYRMQHDPMIRACIATHCTAEHAASPASSTKKPRAKRKTRRAPAATTADVCCQDQPTVT